MCWSCLPGQTSTWPWPDTGVCALSSSAQASSILISGPSKRPFSRPLSFILRAHWDHPHAKGNTESTVASEKLHGYKTFSKASGRGEAERELGGNGNIRVPTMSEIPLQQESATGIKEYSNSKRYSLYCDGAIGSLIYNWYTIMLYIYGINTVLCYCNGCSEINNWKTTKK